jgi:hypothetical protein
MNNNERMTNILSEMMLITDPDCLDKIQKSAFNRKKDVRQKSAAISTASWKVDDEVQMKPEHRSRKPYGTKGKIIKINRVKMHVHFPGFTTYTIPKSMLMKVE